MTQLDVCPSQICQSILASANSSMLCSSQSSQVECSQGIPRMRSVYKGPRVVGRRVYDSMLGVTCHWCRQKTVEDHVRCCRCPVSFCGQCLRNRHGEFMYLEIQTGVNWLCPKCRGGCGEGCDHCCNCGPCRKARGLGPTGLLIHTARACGFTNVHDFLIHQQTGETPEAISLRKKDKEWCKTSEVPPEEIQMASQVVRAIPRTSKQNSKPHSVAATPIDTQTAIAGIKNLGENVSARKRLNFNSFENERPRKILATENNFNQPQFSIQKTGNTSSLLHDKTNQQLTSGQTTINFKCKKNRMRPKPEPAVDVQKSSLAPFLSEPVLNNCSQPTQSKVKDEPATEGSSANNNREKKSRKAPKVPRIKTEKSVSGTTNTVSNPSGHQSTSSGAKDDFTTISNLISNIVTSASLPAIVKKELIRSEDIEKDIDIQKRQCSGEKLNQDLSLSRPVKEETKDLQISNSPIQNTANSSAIASKIKEEANETSLCDVVIDNDQNMKSRSAPVRTNKVPESKGSSSFGHMTHLWKPDGYRSKLQQKLSEPFNLGELNSLTKSICHKHATSNRSKTKQGGFSYLDHHPDLASKLTESSDLNVKLSLLRGFFFWLEHAGTQGAYQPWTICLPKSSDTENDDCVEVDGPDCEILAVVCSLDDD